MKAAAVKQLLARQLTLAGSKLAADTMTALVTPLGLSVLSILWTLGRTLKSNVFRLIRRDWTTVSHTISDLIERGLVEEKVVSHKEKYLSLSTAGYEIYVQYIAQAANLAEELESLMPKTHIETEQP